MNHFHDVLSSLKLISPVYEISDVFVIPKKNDEAFLNFYSRKIIDKKRKFFLRSFGGPFCITPFSLWKNNKKATIFSIGDGLYQNQETNLLLIELFSKEKCNFSSVHTEINNHLLKRQDILDYDIVETDRWSCCWLNISVILK
ncbi:hypothetical protein HOO54_16310 [Bacillus sp. WMMC1349]|uniref:hypothetical protein n=1 Tax=Bacillus sp. WMMC1349 TaxID=2736254 RepID=UPI001553D6BE|nr:hypothetical protein [Bacillus sp. WMMC1349]NPC93755.1 hypothetical protein [Bacillus sp. WMMC1349]